MILLRELIAEYTDEEKSQMGIPLDAVARGGVWYVGDKYAGEVKDGKFVPAEKEKNPSQTQTQQVPGATVGDIIHYDGNKDDLFGAHPKHLELLGQLGIERPDYVESRVVTEEISEHAQFVRSQQVEKVNPLLRSIVFWAGDGIWRREKKMRELTFQTVDAAIDNADLRIKNSPYLYRGLHNDHGNVTHITHEIFQTYRVGNVVKLPPSGFTLDVQKALDFARLGMPKLGIFFKLKNKPEGIKGMHISDEDINMFHSDEKEIITRSGEYKILSVKLTPVLYSKLGGYKGEFIDNGEVYLDDVHAMCMDIELEQLDSVSEQKTVVKENPIISLLMGDTMRGTQKNIEFLEKKWSKK